MEAGLSPWGGPATCRGSGNGITPAPGLSLLPLQSLFNTKTPGAAQRQGSGSGEGKAQRMSPACCPSGPFPSHLPAASAFGEVGKDKFGAHFRAQFEFLLLPLVQKGHLSGGEAKAGRRPQVRTHPRGSWWMLPGSPGPCRDVAAGALAQSCFITHRVKMSDDLCDQAWI